MLVIPTKVFLFSLSQFIVDSIQFTVTASGMGQNNKRFPLKLTKIREL
jgi:hypothetical protein